jgi:DNA-binding GntR family transcriptional regulator
VSSSAHRVTEALREDVLSGFFAPGSRLREVTLLERYGVSRVPVREALRALAGEGFVDLRPNAGATVAQVPLDDVADLFTVRSVVEGLTAARCARRVAAGDDGFVAELRSLVAQGPVADVPGGARLTAQFHDTLARESGSPSLAVVLRQVSERIRWAYSTTVPQSADRAWNEHGRIVDAIAAGDADLAERRMQDHLDLARGSFTPRPGP